MDVNKQRIKFKRAKTSTLDGERERELGMVRRGEQSVTVNNGLVPNLTYS